MEICKMTIKRNNFLHLDNGYIIKKSKITSIRIVSAEVPFPPHRVVIEGNCYIALPYSTIEEAEDCLIRLKQQFFAPSKQENKDENLQ
jgi:hypothetical protein